MKTAQKTAQATVKTTRQAVQTARATAHTAATTTKVVAKTAVSAIKAAIAAAHDELNLSGARATWPEILAVYAVKTASDPTNGLEVVTMDDTKKELLKQVF